MGCLDESTVLDFVEGKLCEGEISRVEAHLDTCSACRHVVALAAEVPESQQLTVAEGRAVPLVSGVAHKRPTSASHPGEECLARGSKMDRFVILNRLGAGGMGVVYAAYDPELDRKVAIKVLRSQTLSGHAAQDLKLRFRREAQAMARLDHPHVISVFDVGTLGTQVFLAMELVNGGTLRDWLRDAKRGWREVLGVLRQAGEGLAAAHRAGLIHRDFKPDNVLVGKDGRVRVSDFGLARAVEDLGEPPSIGRPDPTGALDSNLTRVGTVLGTPAYMAPEQRLGKPTDARSDQFSFCVTLYEGLYGVRPFDRLEDAGAFELPAPAATHVPDWVHGVIARGARPDPDARFASMDELLATLVPPRPRWPWWIVGGACAVTTLAAGIHLSTGQTDGEDPCGAVDQPLAGVWDAGKKQAVKVGILSTNKPWAQSASASVQRDLDAYASAWVDLRRRTCLAARSGESTSTLEDLRVLCLTRRLDELSALTRLLAQGDAAFAERSLQAVQSLTPVSRCEDVAVLMSQAQPLVDPERRLRVQKVRETLAEANVLAQAGKDAQGLEVAARAVTAARDIAYKPLLGEALVLHGAFLADLAQPNEAMSAYREAARLGVESRDDETVAMAQLLLGSLLGTALARFEEALEAIHLAGAHIQRIGSPRHLKRQHLLSLAQVLWMQGKMPEAERALEQALALFSPDDADVSHADALDELGEIQFLKGQLEQAAETYRASARIREKALGPDHPDTATSLEKLASLSWAEGRYDQAVERFEQARAIYLGSRDDDHPSVVTVTANLAVVTADQGRPDEAYRILQQVLPKMIASRGADHPETARLQMTLGTVLRERDQLDEADVLLQHVQDVFAAASGRESIDVAMVLFERAELARRRRSFARAHDLYDESLALVEVTMGKDYRGVGHVLTGKGRVFVEQGRYREAIPCLERALGQREADRIGPEMVAQTRFALAQALLGVGRRQEAKDLAAKAMDGYEASSIADKQRRRDAVGRWLRSN